VSLTWGGGLAVARPDMTERELADFLAVSMRTLRKWRRESAGPLCETDAAGAVLYRWSAVQAYLAERAERP
jgi:phage terminase Nu1 subunit (DNA packaging protein)